MVKKAELHVHLEGTITPSLVTKLAKRNKIKVPQEIFGENETFIWNDFLDFLRTFDIAAGVIRTPEDYQDITYDYLKRCAEQRTIYVELMASPDHAALVGLSYKDHIDGIAQGIRKAKADFGIEARIIATCVRHFGFEKCLNVAKDAIKHPNPLVVGFGMGGDEVNFPAKDFAKVYQVASEGGLGCTAHAGEVIGPESVWDVLNHLPVTRIGHGVRSIEDPKLIDEIIARGITLEVCPGSNLALGVYASLELHPFVELKNKGVKVTLSSDDPPYFATSIGNEYKIAREHFKLGVEELIQITRTSLENSFAEPQMRRKLLDQLA